MTESTTPAPDAATHRRLVDRFRHAGANNPTTAIPIEGMRLLERRQFERMRKAGVIRDADDGRFWLNEPIASAWVASRRKRAMLTAAGTVAAGLVAFGLSRKR